MFILFVIVVLKEFVSFNYGYLQFYKILSLVLLVYVI